MLSDDSLPHPETVPASETAASETAASETAASETAASETAASETAASETPASETAASETASKPSAGLPRKPWSPPMAIKASVAFHSALAAGVALYPNQWQTALKLLAANHAAIGICGMLPRASLIGRTICRIPTQHAGVNPEVALTFDDGPDPEVTPRVLDLLDHYQAKATFFCIGKRVELYPQLAREIVKRGHLIENHTYHHSHTFAFRFYRGLEKEIQRAQHAVEQVTGRRPLYFRAPAGIRNFFLDPLLENMDMKLVAWTRRGFDAVNGNPDQVVPRLVRGLSAGDILLLHDGNAARNSDGRPVVIESLTRLLDLFDRRGLKAVSLPSDL